MVTECRMMMMGFVKMLMQMGPEEMMSMLPGEMGHGMGHEGMGMGPDGMGMEHDGMEHDLMPESEPEPEPESEPEPEPMGEGMAPPPACAAFMSQCMMMMRPGPAGPRSGETMSSHRYSVYVSQGD